MLLKVDFDVLISSYDVKKQTTRKKKKDRLDNLSFSSTRIFAIYNRNLTHIT